jgi:hypothetical protein
MTPFPPSSALQPPTTPEALFLLLPPSAQQTYQRSVELHEALHRGTPLRTLTPGRNYGFWEPIGVRALTWHTQQLTDEQQLEQIAAARAYVAYHHEALTAACLAPAAAPAAARAANTAALLAAFRQV